MRSNGHDVGKGGKRRIIMSLAEFNRINLSWCDTKNEKIVIRTFLYELIKIKRTNTWKHWL